MISFQKFLKTVWLTQSGCGQSGVVLVVVNSGLIINILQNSNPHFLISLLIFFD